MVDADIKSQQPGRMLVLGVCGRESIITWISNWQVQRCEMTTVFHSESSSWVTVVATVSADPHLREGFKAKLGKKTKTKKNTRRRSPFFTAGQRLFSSEAERRGQLSCAIKAQQAARRNASRLGGLRANILVPNVPFGAGRHQGQQPSRRKGSECWLSITRVVPFCFPFLSLCRLTLFHLHSFASSALSFYTGT